MKGIIGNRIALYLACALLYVNGSAQCVDVDWYSHAASLPSGTVTSTAQNPTTHFSHDGQFIYTVLEYSGAEELYFDADIVEPDLCNGPGSGVIIQKFTTSGTLLWRKVICYAFGLVQGNTVDDSGAIYIGGFFKGSLRLESQEIGFVPLTGTAYYLLRLLPNGNLDWVETGDQSGGTIGLEWAGDGLVFMLAVNDTIDYRGVSYSSPQPSMSRDWLVFKVTSTGDVVWHDAIVGLNNEVVQYVVCEDGTCLIQGRFEEDIEYQGQVLTGSSIGQLFQLSVRASDGQHLWMNKQTNSCCAVLVHGAVVLEDSLIMSAGYYVGSPPTFSIDGYNISAAGGADGYLLLQNFQSGEVYSLKTLGGDGSDGIISMSKTNSGVAVAGFFDSQSVDYEGIHLKNHSLLNDPFILVLDKDAKPLCQIQGLGTPAAEGIGSLACHNNELACTLASSDSTAFGAFIMTSVGGSDYALWKTCLPCDTLTGLSERASKPLGLSIRPNPANTSTTLTLPVAGTYNIMVLDAIGRVVYQDLAATTSYQLTTANWPQGIYAITATNKEGVQYTSKLVVGR